MHGYAHCKVTRKRTYRTYADAAKSINRIAIKGQRDLGALQVYWCRLCERGFHVGHARDVSREPEET